MSAKAHSRVGAPMALVALCAWVVGLVSTLMPEGAVWVAAVAWFAVLLLLVIAVRSRQGTIWVIVAAVIAIVSGHAALIQLDRAAFSAAGDPFTGEVTVTGSVRSPWEGAWRFEGNARRTTGEEAVVAVLFVGGSASDIRPGAVVRVQGRTEPTRPGDRAVVLVRATAPRVITPAAGALRWAADARAWFVAQCASFPGAGAQLLPGLAIGDTSAVDAGLDAAMKVSSLSHLTAVSGANCVIVVGAGFGLAALCRAPRWGRVMTALVALGGFVLLVTPEPSVVRAATMAAVAMLALLLGRARAGLAMLSTAVVVLLCVDPWLASSVGFVLSVAATASLLLLARPVAATLGRFMPTPLALMISVPLVAQLVCAPILILLTPAVSLTGVIANIVAAPAAPLATIVGLVACLSAGIPGVGFMLTAVAWVPAQWVGSCAEFFAAIPDSQLAWMDGVLGAGALAAVSAATVMLLVRSRRPGLRSASIAVLAVTVGIIAGLWTVRSVVVPALLPGEWTMAACEVGQGDAMVLRSGGQVVLVDTGPEPGLLAQCLAELRIGRIDVLVLTHFDADHVAGASAVIGRVGLVMHGPPDTGEHRALLEQFANAGATVRSAVIGDELSVADARVRVVWPPPAVEPGNDAGVVIEWASPALRVILLGDLSADAQQRLLSSRELRPPYGVVKVAHHGSADQLDRLYGALGASVGVIGVGKGNDYGHPRQKTLDLLAHHGITAFRTDTMGMVLVSVTGEGIAVWQEERE